MGPISAGGNRWLSHIYSVCLLPGRCLEGVRGGSQDMSWVPYGAEDWSRGTACGGC